MNAPLSKPARTMVVYGIYVILGLGLPFLLVPGLILPLVGMAAPADVWVHVLGMTVLFLGFYYIQMGRNELTQFMRWSVYARLLVPVFSRPRAWQVLDTLVGVTMLALAASLIRAAL